MATREEEEEEKMMEEEKIEEEKIEEERYFPECSISTLILDRNVIPVDWLIDYRALTSVAFIIGVIKV